MAVHKSIRVLIIGDYIFDWGGNKISGFKELARVVEETGGFVVFAFPVSACSCKWTHELQNPMYFYNDVSFSSICYLVNRAVCEYKVNIIHTHFWGPREIARLKVANRGRCKLVYHIRTFPVHKNDIFRKIFHHIVFYKGIKVCISEGTKKAVECRYSKRNVHLIYNGLDLNRLAIQNKENIEFCTYGRKILIMGYYFYRKGVDLALLACKEIESRCNFRLYIISDNLEECRRMCKKVLNSASLPDWVEILPTIENIESYYHNVDVFLSPSRSEAFGMSSIEAAYCGCKIIASKVPGQEEIGIPETIWISNPEENESGAIKELAKSILNISSTKNMIQKNESVKKYIAQNFSLQKWAEAVVNLYQLKD